MTCRACTDAMREPTRDEFRRGCRSCEARALASIGAHVESLELRCITPQYRATLEALFGERWEEGHRLVRHWGAKIASCATHKRVRA